MSRKTYLYLISVLFGAMGLLHLLRLLYGWGANIGGLEIPMWGSAVGLVVAFALGWKACILARK